MKFIKLAPIAAAIAAMPVFAAAPAANITIYAAGASAQLGSISNIMTTLCKPNVGTTQQIEFYQGFGTSTGGSGTASNSNLRAFRCDLASTDPQLAGKKVLFVYSAIDGSASGVQFVARGLPRQFIKFESCPSAPSVASTPATSIATVPTGSKQFNCNGTGAGATSTTTTEAQVPIAGASDVEPAAFIGVNAPGVGPLGAMTSVDLANLNINGSRAVIFGVVANKAMWSALLANPNPQMPVTTAVSGTNGLTNTTNTSFNETLRPSIAKWQYRAIATGGLNDMSYLTVTNSTPTGVPGLLKLARRVPGSGTQTISNIFFLNNPCGDLTGSSLTPAVAGDSAGNILITEGSGTSDVLKVIQDSTTPAIGVVSLENPERGAYTLNAIGTADTTPKQAIGFLKIDGVTANRDNAISGAYDFYGEETFQWNKNAVASGSDTEAFLTAFVGKSGEIATLQSLSLATQAGSAALAAYNGFSAISPTINKSWVLRADRTGNNCAPATRIIE